MTYSVVTLICKLIWLIVHHTRST